MSRQPVRPVQVRMRDIELSALAAGPADGDARGLILALHGGGYSAGYWHCPAGQGRLSMLELGAGLGFHVLAVDRPGYGASQHFDPEQLGFASQVSFLFDVIETWSDTLGFDGPAFVIGHSIGGILALLMAADPRGTRLGGIDVLGVPLRFAAGAVGEEVNSWSMAGTHVPPPPEAMGRSLMYGPDGTWGRDAFDHDRTLTRPMPVAEYRDALAMPQAWPSIMPTIRVPVQFTSAEHEAMMEAGADTLREAEALLRNSANARCLAQPAAGHNASLHHVGRAYHLRALAYFEECIALQAGL